ncbi:MAG: hypothetical protein AB4352_08950 [Hormoscilla sp.]
MGNSLTTEAIDLLDRSDPLNNLTALGTAENAVNLPGVSTNSADSFTTVMNMIVDDNVIQNVLT